MSTARELALLSVKDRDPKLTDQVTAVCLLCGNELNKRFGYVVKCCRNSRRRYRCRPCSNKEISSRSSVKEKIARTKSMNQEYISTTFKNLWKDKEYRNKVMMGSKKAARTTAGIEQRRQQAIKAWRDSNYRDRVSSKSRENYSFEFTDDIRKKLSEATKRQWRDPEYRTKMVKILADASSKSPRVSSIQLRLYAILDGLRIGYHREYNDRPDDTQCRIGPYSFDCVIPKEMGPDILIECQGDYWHNLPENKTRDARKAAYVFKNYKDSYALEYIWEHEFKDASAVKTRLHELVDGEVYVN